MRSETARRWTSAPRWRSTAPRQMHRRSRSARGARRSARLRARGKWARKAWRRYLRVLQQREQEHAQKLGAIQKACSRTHGVARNGAKRTAQADGLWLPHRHARPSRRHSRGRRGR
jgi:hypothetical protein